MTKFGLVGLGSVGVYFLVLLVLRDRIDDIVDLTAISYVASAVFNYLLQRYVTFNSSRPRAGSWFRYVCLHVLCMTLNSGLMSFLVEMQRFGLIPSQVLVTIIVAGTSFLLSYLWVYK